MSSPARQVGTRRLPPLPLNRRVQSPYQPYRSTSGFLNTNSPSSPYPTVGNRPQFFHSGGGNNGTNSSGNQMVVTGQSTTIGPSSSRQYLMAPSFNHHSHHHHHTLVHTDSMEGYIPPSEQPLMREQVKTYLNDNPDFVEEYVLNNINQSQLEKWTAKYLTKHDNSHHHVDHNIVNGTGDFHTKRSMRWMSPHKRDRRKVLFELTQDLQQQPHKVFVLHELAECVAALINADSYRLYLVNETEMELYEYKPGESWPDTSSSQRWSIEKGKTFAGFVAYSQSAVCTNDLAAMHTQYPEGLALKDTTIKAALGLPIFHANNNVSGFPGIYMFGAAMGVLEFHKKTNHPGFTESEEEIASNFLVWGSLAYYYAEIYQNMTRQRKLNDFIMNVTKSIFQDIISMDSVIMKIMNFAQRLVSADRASLFLVDNKSKELYARIFDVGDGQGSQVVTKDHKEIRFPIGKGVAGHVATSGEILNIPDAYLDDRFNRQVDIQTGYVTKSLLCMPIKIRGHIIGVVQMVNKKSGAFTRADEQAFETFAVYCGLALHHAKLYDKIRRSEQKHRVALEILSYHRQCSEEEFTKLINMQVPDPVPDLARYDFSPWSLDEDTKPLYVICMFKELFDLQRPGKGPLSFEERFDYHDLCRFVLTVRKNYRHVPYHNWTHAFSVAHTVYTIIKKSDINNFTFLESLALFIACLCHDLDHRGKNNSYMVNNATPLAAIYSTSTMEHHHFNQTVTILQNDGHNIFRHLTSEEYKIVLNEIRHSILATDLALFFGNKGKLKGLIEKKQFSWEDQSHRNFIKSITMTACDLSASSKPWSIQQQTVKVIFDEFYQQGDEEKAQGQKPIPMMDRDKAHELPANQVSFIVGICLPCYELLYKLVPGSKPLYDGASKNLQNWSALVAKQRTDQEDKEKKVERKQSIAEISKALKESEDKKSESDNGKKIPLLKKSTLAVSKESVDE
ncbi:probable 3',5'-cyclic phosphodiesterase pde-5 isoform X3 [Antedon mediterranea]|uniref:probable 3',5'-cyclic phosphodiesterase pde-5 isoform X3 n=1 Tax=Antedon mediterranea TaxID=105859 RepID=UPI003AF45143